MRLPAFLPKFLRVSPQLTPYVLLSPIVVPFLPFLPFGLFPLGFSLYPAALQTLPKDLYEAAAMDGAGRLQQSFFFITLPSLKPAISFGVTLSVGGGLQMFEQPCILSGGQGGSDQIGMTRAIYLYRMAFDFNDFGAARAISSLLFFVLVVLSWLTNLAFKPRTAGG